MYRNVNVSVIMACYNGAKFITEQLNSIFNQSITPDEIIIIDDCSIDDTCSIIEHNIIDNLNVKLVKHRKNLGYRKTFFEASKIAKGDIIFFADQDDVWCEDKIEYMVDCMLSDKRILALNSSNFFIDEHGNVLKKKINLSRQNIWEVKMNDIMKYNISMGCTMAVRKILFDKYYGQLDFFAELRLPHDWVINILAANNNGLYMSNRKTIYYRLHSQNTIGFKRSKCIKDRVFAYQDMVEQKKDMLVLADLIGCKNEEKVFIKDMINSYTIRINNIERADLIKYIISCFSKKIFSFCRLKTILFDCVLIVKSYII